MGALGALPFSVLSGDTPLKKEEKFKKRKKASIIGYRASLRGLTFFSPLWGRTLRKQEKTQKLGTGLALGALPFSVHSGDIPLKKKKKKTKKTKELGTGLALGALPFSVHS